MKTRTKRRGKALKSVLVKAGRETHAGFLLFETKEFVVLLNNMHEATDIGPLRRVCKNQIEPECDVLVLPRSPDMTVEVLGD